MERPEIFAVLTGIVLASVCGLRAFLPLIAAGLAMRIGWLHLDPRFAWLGENPALISLGVASVLEMIGDKIPIVDHALDVVGTVVRPVAAGVAVLGVTGHLPAPFPALLAILGAAGALGVHAIKAKSRIGSTALTLGHLNPLLSVAEDVTTVIFAIGAVLVPLLAILAFALLIGWLARTAVRQPA